MRFAVIDSPLARREKVADRPNSPRPEDATPVILKFPRRREQPPKPLSDDQRLQRWIDMNG